MTSSIGNINAYSYGSLVSAGSTGKLYVPVNKSSLLYSHFSHISGVAAGSNQNGVSISKIRILNSLIDNLSSPTKAASQKEAVLHMTDDQAEVLIQKYQQQIQQAATSQYLIPGSQVQAGLLFSFNV